MDDDEREKREECAQRLRIAIDLAQTGIEMQIRRDGRTKVVSDEESVSVDGNFIESDAGLADCVGEVIQTLQFPGGGDVMVEKTFIFETS